MIQEILTYTVIAIALGYFAYSMFRTFVPKKGKANAHSCAGCAGGCGVIK